MQATVGVPEHAAVISPILREGGFYLRAGKRIADVVISVVGLIVALPIMLVIAAAIKLDTPGPVLFIQERVGLRGCRFRLYKFRSMTRDAEARRQALLEYNEADGPVFKIRKDPRVTRVGRVLRRTSLDELPQLLNVLLGEMTLVGPRPPLPEEVAQYRPEDRVRLSIRPGLTCLWVIRGRSDCDFERWMEYDREYIARSSFWLYLLILVRTVSIALSGRGAY